MEKESSFASKVDTLESWVFTLEKGITQTILNQVVQIVWLWRLLDANYPFQPLDTNKKGEKLDNLQKSQ